MGEYINPPNQSKEAFLQEHGTITDSGHLMELFDDLDRVGVCLVDNGAFTAAAVAYSEREVMEFTSDRDHRPRKYYSVPRSALRTIGINI